MLTESTSLESVSVGPDGKTKARQVTVIMRDGVEIHRISDTIFIEGDEEADDKTKAILSEVKAKLAVGQKAVDDKEKKRR